VIALTETERLILQKYARKQEGFHSKMGPGWFRWGVERAPGHDPWELDAFRPLVERGLLDFQEDWKHYYVKLTDAAWKALAA
jgi:hypothetical protein